jgi:large subunit ribosomal protein L21
MYAVIKTGGKQYRVAAGEKLKVEQIPAEVGSQVVLDQVLMVSNGAAVTIGKPLVSGARVSATVVSDGRADKVRIFKMRRRKHYQKRQGHRQNYTELFIGSIFDGASVIAEAVYGGVINVPVAKVETAAAPTAAPKAAKAGSKGDDLTKIEGIGPKIAGLLIADGIVTFANLADAKTEKLAEILKAAGPRYSIHKPDTWPQQAALARDGKFDELKKLQDELDGGVDKS